MAREAFSIFSVRCLSPASHGKPERRKDMKRTMQKLALVMVAALAVACVHVSASFAADQDQDYDGVLDGIDACPNTNVPEAVPMVRLGVNIGRRSGLGENSPEGSAARRAATIPHG